MTDNGGGRRIRLARDGSEMTVLQTGLQGAANVEVGAGILNCQDGYAAGDMIYRDEGDTPGAAVPWH